jgi:hypothetical protein
VNILGGMHSFATLNIPLPDIEHRTNNFLRDIVITTDEIVVDIIKILNPNKASGPDIISHKMLKLCPEKIFFSSEFRMQLYISNSWSTVEYVGRKPD